MVSTALEFQLQTALTAWAATPTCITKSRTALDLSRSFINSRENKKRSNR